MGKFFLCGISNVPFEIPLKISYPYIERCVYYLQVDIQKLLDFRGRKRFAICGEELFPFLHSYHQRRIRKWFILLLRSIWNVYTSWKHIS